MGTLNDTLTQQLRSIRTQKEISIESIADKLGMSPDSYIEIENGETPITLDSIENIAKALEVEATELLNTYPSVIGDNNFSGDNNVSFGGAINSHDCYIGVSSEILEKLLKRIDALEAELTASRKQQ